MQKLKDNYSSSLKSMSKTISPSLIILTMIHNLGFVSSATSIFVTLDVIWILVTMTFSPIYTWLEQYICIHKPVRWQGSRVDGSWMFRHPEFFNIFIIFSFLVEACWKVEMATVVLSIPQFNRTGIILLKLVVHYISRHQDHYQNLYANCFHGNGAKKLVGIL
jgi:hypothetical protein